MYAWSVQHHPPLAGPPDERSTAAGLTLLGVLGAAALGAALGGPAGAGAGLLLAGGARNAYVAAQGMEGDEKVAYEAGKTGLLGMAQLGVGAWLAYTASKGRRG